MEILSVDACGNVVKDIDDYLLDVVRKTPNVEYNLRRLPDVDIIAVHSDNTDIALAFKDSLQHLQASCHWAALLKDPGKLFAFKNLVSLDLLMEAASNIIKLESILKNCRGIKTLDVTWN